MGDSLLCHRVSFATVDKTGEAIYLFEYTVSCNLSHTLVNLGSIEIWIMSMWYWSTDIWCHLKIQKDTKREREQKYVPFNGIYDEKQWLVQNDILLFGFFFFFCPLSHPFWVRCEPLQCDNDWLVEPCWSQWGQIPPQDLDISRKFLFLFLCSRDVLLSACSKTSLCSMVVGLSPN